ncbi:MAG: SGNH/GDSL hydrolase family protein [Anaerolineae bacterium]|nr:SGNH/GDSL hydrolase family protein [Anaerolineae bacterium]
MKFELHHLFKYAGLILFGLFVGAAALEIGLRLIPAQTLNLLITRRPLRYQLYQIDPYVGWRLKPNATARYTLESEFDVQVQINAQGLHDVEHAYPKPPGVYRILILGDSFAEGLHVPVAAGFPQRLAGCLNEHYSQPIEVINSGTGYYASAEELFFLQYEGLRYEPDLVLVAFFVGNDINAYASRETEDGWFESLGGYLIELDETGRLKKTWVDWQHPSPYEPVPKLELFLRRYSKLYYVLSHRDSKIKEWLDDHGEAWLTNFGPFSSSQEEAAAESFQNDLDLMLYVSGFPDSPLTPPKLSQAWAILDEIFWQMQTTTAANNAALGVLLIPERAQAAERYYQEEYKKYASRYDLNTVDFNWDIAAPNKALTQLFTQKNIPTLDLLPVFRAYDTPTKPSLYFEQDAHFNQTGHQLTADTTCQWIIEHNFIVP